MLAISTFLMFARIDGQPESTGDMSLMQYVAQSEAQFETGTDEHVACKTFCADKSQCAWGACKGCSFCPEETEGCKSFCADKSQCTWGACKDCSFCPEETEGCKSWCGAHAGSWDKKCKLGACQGCEPCPEPTPAREDCKPWCSPNSSPWDQKCKLGACKGCEPCPEPTPEVANCKPWCKPHPSPWDEKCKLGACKGCEQCPEPTPSSATPSGPLEWVWHEEYEGTLKIEGSLITAIGSRVVDNPKWDPDPGNTSWNRPYYKDEITVVANRPVKRWSVEFKTAPGGQINIGSHYLGVVMENFTAWHRNFEYGDGVGCGVGIATYNGGMYGMSKVFQPTENTVWRGEGNYDHYSHSDGRYGNLGISDPAETLHFSLDDVADGKQELTITRDGVGRTGRYIPVTDKAIFGLPGGVRFLPMLSIRWSESMKVSAEGRTFRIFE